MKNAYNLINKSSNKNALSFIAAFLFVFVYLQNFQSLAASSGDAADIWKYITSLTQEKISPSYVLYKGFASVYPYIWLYQLSLFFKVNDFFFVEIFHSLLFAYIAGIGLPQIVIHLTGVVAGIEKRIALVAVLFLFWRYTGVFSNVMIDLPACFYFILLVQFSLEILNKNHLDSIYKIFLVGLGFGFSLVFSGQYKPAAIIIVIYLFVKLTRQVKSRYYLGIIQFVGIMFIGIIIFMINVLFEIRVVDPLRNSGAWILSSKEWLSMTYINFSNNLRMFWPTVPDIRGLAIMKDLYPADYNALLANEKYAVMSLVDYLKIICHYPFDYLVRYFNKFFLAITLDGTGLRLSYIIPYYSLLFSALWTMFNRIKSNSIQAIFNIKSLIVLSFIAANIAVVIGHSEPRYSLQIQGLIISTAIVGNYYPEKMYQFISKFKMTDRNIRMKYYSTLFNFFVLLCVFLLVCISHLATIYDIMGVESGIILFKF